MSRITEVLLQALRDTLTLFPYIVLAIAVMVIAIVVIKLVNGLIKWLIKVSNLEELLRSILPTGTRFPLTSLIVVITDVMVFSLFVILGIRIISIASPNIYEGAVLYVSRVASVVVTLLILLASLDILTKVITLEKKTESLFFILLFFFGISMFIDLIALSQEMRSSLSLGIAIGIGLSLGIFTLWLLFGERLGRCAEGGSLNG